MGTKHKKQIPIFHKQQFAWNTSLWDILEWSWKSMIRFPISANNEMFEGGFSPTYSNHHFMVRSAYRGWSFFMSWCCHGAVADSHARATRCSDGNAKRSRSAHRFRDDKSSGIFREISERFQCHFQIFLVGGFNPPEKYPSVGIGIANIWKNKTCSKPPTRFTCFWGGSYSL